MITIFEKANRVQCQPQPVAPHLWPGSWPTWAIIPFPNVEYRINDASRVDDDGLFWVINYFWPPSDQLVHDSIPDPIVARWGARKATASPPWWSVCCPCATRQKASPWPDDMPPVQLDLIGGIIVLATGEGLVLLDDLGFLWSQTKHPSTILAFVPPAIHSRSHYSRRSHRPGMDHPNLPECRSRRSIPGDASSTHCFSNERPRFIPYAGAFFV